MRITTREISDRIDSDSHQRAIDAIDDDNALIESTDLDRHYRVMLPDSSQGYHECMLSWSRWGYLVGDCDCAHMSYGDGLCAHILTLLLARERGIETVDGEPVDAGDPHDEAPAGDGDPLISATADADEVTNEPITADGGIETDDSWSDRL